MFLYLLYTFFVEDTNSECVSTGDENALNTAENAPLKTLLTTLNMKSIKLPPGELCLKVKKIHNLSLGSDQIHVVKNQENLLTKLHKMFKMVVHGL